MVDWIGQLIKNMAEYRDKLIEEYINAPFAVGEWVMVARGLFSVYTNNSERKVAAKILEILPDERFFIESIYNDVECGKIVLREYSWETVESRIKNGETQDIAFKDVIDGKQRLHTLKRFVNDEFKDLSGHYYSDLSEKAKREFENSRCLNYLCLSQNATDEEVIKTFLMVNVAGKPMPQEHLDYVNHFYKKIIH